MFVKCSECRRGFLKSCAFAKVEVASIVDMRKPRFREVVPKSHRWKLSGAGSGGRLSDRVSRVPFPVTHKLCLFYSHV